MTDLMEIYRKLATIIRAHYDDKEGEDVWEEIDIWDYARRSLPRGGMIGEATIDVKKSGRNKIVFCSSMECYTDHWFHDGTLAYEVTITPSLFSDVSIMIKCKSNHMREYYNENLDYLYELYTP